MKVSIVAIGNSKGIRIPRALLELCRIKKEVYLDVQGDVLMITPVKKRPREGWSQAFKEMRRREDDRLLIADDLDWGIWEW